MHNKLDAKHNSSGVSEVVVLIKASPNLGNSHGQTVCCAGLDAKGNWLRLYPIVYGRLKKDQTFMRWDRISFTWRYPKSDARKESRRIEETSIAIIGKLKEKERSQFITDKIVSSLKEEYNKGNSLALLCAKNYKFSYERKNPAEIKKEEELLLSYRKQTDLFSDSFIPTQPCPFQFFYEYETDDGIRKGCCQDWETDTTFFKWRQKYDEQEALKKMQNIFGQEYPEKGMLLAMGTHSKYPNTWLINGIIRYKKDNQLMLL